MRERTFLPRLIAWEITGRCNLRCVHCRASANLEPDPEELTTEEIQATLDNIATFAHPILILTGGEPLLREDVFEIASHATERGLRVVLGTNGTLLTPQIARRLLASGVKRVAISIDCAYSEEHDGFRGVPGAFEEAMRGIEACKEVGLPFQINTTVTRRNLRDLPRISEMAVDLGAVAHHIFLLVPTGRGKVIEEEEIPPEEYEGVLNWMYDVQKAALEGKGGGIKMKATCAPHYVRVIQERSREEGIDVTRGREGLDAMSSGCLGGTGFCFISRKGEVHPCGYLPVEAGNLRERSFREIWESSPLFQDLRDRRKLKGKCGHCEYKVTCGGCRARAYAQSGDWLGEEPYCIHQPKAWKRKSPVSGP
jgi:heme b synthase